MLENVTGVLQNVCSLVDVIDGHIEVGEDKAWWALMKCVQVLLLVVIHIDLLMFVWFTDRNRHVWLLIYLEWQQGVPEHCSLSQISQPVQ